MKEKSNCTSVVLLWEIPIYSASSVLPFLSSLEGTQMPKSEEEGFLPCHTQAVPERANWEAPEEQISWFFVLPLGAASFTLQSDFCSHEEGLHHTTLNPELMALIRKSGSFPKFSSPWGFGVTFLGG